MKKISILIMCVLFVVACSSNRYYIGNPSTGEKKINKTSKYALGGVLAGALAGQLLGKDTKSTLIGAGAGALAGAGLGYYFDRQEALLRKELQNTGVSLEKNGNKLKLVMPGNLMFNSNSSNINSNFYDILNSVSIILKKYNKTYIFISGHTDNTGKKSHNITLSHNRALSVEKYLKSRGIEPYRMKIRGYGSAYPIATNKTPAGRKSNSRVEIEITEKKQ